MATEAKGRVLYIDDDPGIARLVCKAFEACGFVAEHAASGALGVERIRNGGIDCVALDQIMPGETGLEVLEKIKALLSS